MTLPSVPVAAPPSEVMPDPDNLRIDPTQLTGPITIPRL
jgi:hypothetical protein